MRSAPPPRRRGIIAPSVTSGLSVTPVQLTLQGVSVPVAGGEVVVEVLAAGAHASDVER